MTYPQAGFSFSGIRSRMGEVVHVLSTTSFAGTELRSMWVTGSLRRISLQDPSRVSFRTSSRPISWSITRAYSFEDFVLFYSCSSVRFGLQSDEVVLPYKERA